MCASYWNYYEPNLPMPDNGSPEVESREYFYGLGLDAGIVERLISSGFVAFPCADILVDRHRGGALSWPDGRTRFLLNLESIERLLESAESRTASFPVFEARNPDTLRRFMSQLQSKYSYPLAFRGQTRHYWVDRKVRHPSVVHPELGETSLLPSVWRKALEHKQEIIELFRGPELYFWSAILSYSYGGPAVDLEIAKPTISLRALPLTVSELADHVDPRLSRIGVFKKTFSEQYGLGGSALANTLNTFLQHYGLFSPLLDLSLDIDVALFFATNRFSRKNDHCTYEATGSNQDQAIIYALGNDEIERHNYSRNEFFEALSPLRPEKQQCVVVGSDSFALNLPADFIVGAVRLVGEDGWDSKYSVADLFPSASEDFFLKALKLYPKTAKLITDFSTSSM